MIRGLDGKSPKIHPTAFISETAYIVGDVEIGEGSSIWPGAVIRADAGKIEIGRFTCIQDNSVVHGDDDVKIGDRVVIGHRVLCHAKTVGDGALIGNGSIVNDGALIGEGSLVGSGAMLIENMKVPAGMMALGVPGRVRGEVQERHRQLMASTAEHYIEKAERFKRQGNLESEHLGVGGVGY